MSMKSFSGTSRTQKREQIDLVGSFGGGWWWHDAFVTKNYGRSRAMCACVHWQCQGSVNVRANDVHDKRIANSCCCCCFCGGDSDSDTCPSRRGECGKGAENVPSNSFISIIITPTSIPFPFCHCHTSQNYDNFSFSVFVSFIFFTRRFRSAGHGNALLLFSCTALALKHTTCYTM